MKIWTFIRDLVGALPFQVKAIASACLFGLILLLIILGRVGACRERHADEKLANQKTNVTIDKVESNVLSNERRVIVEESNNAQRQANLAGDNLNRALDRDSRSYQGDSTDRFCTRFPNDSTCKEWRQRR